MYRTLVHQISTLGYMTSTQVSNYCHRVFGCGDKAAGGYITQAKKHGLIQEAPPIVVMGRREHVFTP